VEGFSSQYDFFYGSGASTLVDRNYNENFRYFQPLWLRDEIPDFFVIFKIPGPLSYPYSTNQTEILSGTQYKIIQDVNSPDPFVISYGVDNFARPILYRAGEFMVGNSVYSTYEIVSGSGKVVLMNETLFQPEVDDVNSYFNSKILPNAAAIATFDLREDTVIGKYIRSIINDPGFSSAPLDFSYQLNAFTYYQGVDIKTGSYSKKGELMYDFLISNNSTPQIDFENYVTGGFERNGIIIPNLLNLEFLFNDPDSDLYSINRYFGLYVSRNDLGSFKLNGDFFYQYRNLSGNNNLPKPSTNNVGYASSTDPNYLSSTTGVRLFYQEANSWIPGSYDVNVLEPQKLFYITDKNDKFYSLLRNENYDSTTQTWSNNTPVSGQFGPLLPSGNFGTESNMEMKSGNLVVFNRQLNLLDFTGPNERIGGFSGFLPESSGHANINIQFLSTFNSSTPVTFKIIWPNGTRGPLNEKYDLIQSSLLGGSVLNWQAGSSYNNGNTHYFNFSQGQTSQVASSFVQCVLSISSTIWDSANSDNNAIIRARNSGANYNTDFKIAVFSDYDSFESSYAGIWSSTAGYSAGQIVSYFNVYYTASSAITAPSSGNTNPPPTEDNTWQNYFTFTTSGLIKIENYDVSALDRNLNFVGGTDFSKSRVAFSINEKDKITPGKWIEVEGGRGVVGSVSRISSVTRYVDRPIYNNNPSLTSGTVTEFRGYNEFLVASLEDTKAIISLGSDGNFNVWDVATLYSGAFSFFDLKDFDYDFLSSKYGETPTPEFHRYFQLVPDQPGQIVEGVKYIVRSGEILVDKGSPTERILGPGSAFIGTTVNYFQDILFSETGTLSVVYPAVFSQVGWVDPQTPYPTTIVPEQNLNSFEGFYGIQSISNEMPIPNPLEKAELFEYGKLETEYQYLWENFTQTRANFSRIVPFVNKWGFLGGTDARGNVYRLNSSPAFSPTNFSPSFQKESPDPRYLTHEWLILQGVPPQFPIDDISKQKSYLPGEVDFQKLRSGNPNYALYFNSFFTVSTADYPAPYYSLKYQGYEYFSNLNFNYATGFYETVFRGVKIVLKKRSSVTNPKSELEKYIINYRGYENYNFSAILKVVPEDDSEIQSPVRYEFIENVQQKCVLLVVYVVIKDYRALPLGSTGGTGGTPYLDYLLMYCMSDKKEATDVGTTGATGPTGSPLYDIADIKLSAALNLSTTSDSSVTLFSNSGKIFTIENPDFDTDLREEINLFYPIGSTGSVSDTGPGSFYVPSQSYTYPWPVGRSQNLVDFQAIEPGAYEFQIPFAFSSPVTIPVGPRSAYANYPVFQVDGGEDYFDFILKRISLSQIYLRVNNESPYISYTTYDWDPIAESTLVSQNSFQVSFTEPTALYKPTGLYPVKSYEGPQTLGTSVVTSYQIENGGSELASDILRYGGAYEPLFKKVLRFKGDKTDSISGNPGADITFRNCTFAPEQEGFGLIENLAFSKVSLDQNILQASQNLPQGPVFPLVGQSPISYKNFSVFLSSWDPGYYNLWTSATTQNPVAGTRSMKENKSFLGSKMMQTPYTVTIYTFITLELVRTSGNTNVDAINTQAVAAVPAIQNLNPSTSNTGVGQLGNYLSNVDLPVFDQDIFPQVEIFWQRNEISNTVIGSIRLDRILRRYLLNSGVSQVFVDNMVSEFGLGNPNSIYDDINTYIDQNIVPIYEGITFDLFVKKTGEALTTTELLVRGDLINPDRIRYGYYQQNNYRLTKITDLIYSFEYPLTVGQNYSLTFSFRIQKI
jgi:hypothetical protein